MKYLYLVMETKRRKLGLTFHWTVSDKFICRLRSDTIIAKGDIIHVTDQYFKVIYVLHGSSLPSHKKIEEFPLKGTLECSIDEYPVLGVKKLREKA